jgi:hypothetical protein
VQDHILSIVGYVLRAHTLCQSLYKKFKYLYKRKKLHIVQVAQKNPKLPMTFLKCLAMNLAKLAMMQNGLR